MDYAILEWEHDELKKKAFIENLAPIVLFTYNRLDHTKQTIEALQKNFYAKESNIYIYSDAPKTEEFVDSVNSVRRYIKSIKGFKSITIIERKYNWGLAKNIIDGVTEIINKYGKIIVLEDDIVTSKYFLKYMNDALEIYKNHNKVMQVSGYLFPIDNSNLPETFFSRMSDCWGWATWSESWKFFERNPKKTKNDFKRMEIYQFNFENNIDFWQQVLDNYDEKIYTWAVFWATIIFKMEGLVLYPKFSMARNIGLDNSGENCNKTNIFDVDLYESEIKFFSYDIKENLQGYLAFKKYFKRINRNIIRRFMSKLSRMILNKINSI